MTFITRFAPSPTGPLHLGHAYSALLASDMTTAHNGQFLLRIEDIDQSRARAKWTTQICDDLLWLGLKWPAPVMRQSQRQSSYKDALTSLAHHGVLYSCSCNRRDIINALNAPQEGVPFGPDGIIYPQTCRPNTITFGPFPDTGAIRLDLARAFDAIGRDTLYFTETGNGDPKEYEITRKEAIKTIGDVVVSRRDMGTSYHLSVVVDDTAQNITHVIRGRDLFEATKIHVILQSLLGMPIPIYHHHRLIRDDHGKRLAKRDDARAIKKYRDDGKSPQDIRDMVGL